MRGSEISELYSMSHNNLYTFGKIKNYYTVHDLKMSHFFSKKKLQKSVTIWEYLPKRYHFWTIMKQKKEKSVTIWKKSGSI